jgi:hypothetical protein
MPNNSARCAMLPSLRAQSRVSSCCEEATQESHDSGGNTLQLTNFEGGTLTETHRIWPQRVLAQDQIGSFVAVPRDRTAHTGARHMTLLRGHSLLRARCHLWVATGARVPLTLVLGLLLLSVEWRCEGRSLLAVLLLHVRRKALVRTGGLHHVRARTWRTSVPIRACALLRHVWHLRLGVRRHGRVSLVLRRHESI